LLGSAQAAGHEAGQGWAHHELGSLHLCAGEPRNASEHLREALRLEERLGDFAGRCPTRHNLDSAERDVALSGGGGGQSARRLLRLAGLATAFALLGAGGGVGIALAIRDEGATPGQAGTHSLTVEFAGRGIGTVSGAGIACPNDCVTAVEDGQTLTLTARPGAGSLLGRWEGVDCGRRSTCQVAPADDVTATAVFVRATDRQPPSTPIRLRATAVNAGEIDLSWLKSSDNGAVTGYVVYRDGAKLTGVPGTTAVFQDTTVAASTSYVYAVQAVDAAGNASAQWDPARATTPGSGDTEPPSAPARLRATAVNDGEIDLSWLKSTDNVAVTGYVVYRDGAKLRMVFGSTTVFRDTTVAASTGYVYAVRAIDAAGNASVKSDPAKATTPAPDTEPPSTPTSLRATAVSAGEIDLSWSASSDNVAVTGYIIFRDGAELTTVAGTKTTFQDTTVAAATGYVYTVQAIDAAGNASAQSGRTKAKTPAAR
jgi:chitodextrinase